jgi:hypothetical protein
MKKMLSSILLFSSLCVLHACAVTNPRPLMSELVIADYPITYINDGAGDESVLNTLHYSNGQNNKCRNTLNRMVDLKEKAIPLLIAHLDDMSPTRAKYQQNEGLAVPFGFVCLDILIQITDSPAIIHDCKHDGMGACVHSPYYYMPDVSAKHAAIVKEHWQALYQAGKIKYVYPEWWKQRS